MCYWYVFIWTYGKIRDCLCLISWACFHSQGTWLLWAWRMALIVRRLQHARSLPCKELIVCHMTSVMRRRRFMHNSAGMIKFQAPWSLGQLNFCTEVPVIVSIIIAVVAYIQKCVSVYMHRPSIHKLKAERIDERLTSQVLHVQFR